jgi:RoxA-like, cytochrome c-like
MRHRFLLRVLLCAIVAAEASAANAQGVTFADQGSDWTEPLRADFYSRDQGSKMIPLGWLRALQQPNGQPFLADSLARYGYLRNPANDNTTKLPVGFTASGPTGARVVGMTCAACHTRQITVEGKSYRIDGGPAIVDFQSFLADLDAAVGRVLASDAAFNSFAAAVLPPNADNEDIGILRREVDAWYLRYHTLITRALPTPAWGPARLDAVGMIFNRLTGLDIGPPPSHIIADNIKRADAPVRYPFLWNAPIQDQTQWPGFADNGNDILGLARNLGEVFGVFASFAPTRDGLFIDFVSNNSANFDGLTRLEELIKQIGPPKWPWRVDPALRDQGKAIYDRPTAQGGCKECHNTKPNITPGKERLGAQTWATPIQNVGTDTREYDVLGWTVDTGVLQGAFISFLTSPLKANDRAFNVLATSVLGSIAEQTLISIGVPPVLARTIAPVVPVDHLPKLVKLPPSLQDLKGMFKESPEKGAYESRVMEGIWAAAPYLHNGSVPTLAELLKPPAERVAAFKIGSNYDIENVGLAVEQTQFGNYTLTTTDCSDRNSGNSRCGHDFGTRLSPPEKKALLEYLKTL